MSLDIAEADVSQLGVALSFILTYFFITLLFQVFLLY
jgi:hypothetical protein